MGANARMKRSPPCLPHDPLARRAGRLNSAAMCLALTTAGYSATHGVEQSKDVWKVGVARARITPEQPMWMAGYASRDHPATGKLTDLWAKVLVLEDANGHEAVLIALDVVGIDRDLSVAICDELHARFGISREQVAICASHTHTGPVVRKNLAPLHYLQLNDQHRTLVEQYTASLQNKVIEAVGQAWGERAPGHVHWGSGQATFAVNRRNNSESQVSRLRAQGALVGPVDYDVPVLAVRDLKQQLVAVLFGYACHATVLSSYEWSGDYPGYAQIEIEKTYPDCTAIFWAGCGADQNPLPRREVALAQTYGKRLASAVVRTLEGIMPRVGSSLQTQYTEVPLPLAELPSAAELQRDTASKNRYVAARAEMLLQQIRDGRPLQPDYPYPIGLFRLGNEIELITLGGEVVVDYALRLKSELNGRRTWVAGYAHDVMAYIPSRRVLREGGYEGGGAMVYYGLPTVWAPEVEGVIVKAIHGLRQPTPARQ